MSGLQNGGSPRSNRNEIENLKRKNEYLESQLEQLTHKTARLSDDSGQYYVATASNIHGTDKDKVKNALRPMPKIGSAARHVATYIRDHNVLDFNPRLNTSSYVNVIFEPEELEVANMGLSVNLADQTVYPQSYELHNMCINMVAQLWNCPETDEIRAEKVFPGAGTVGSTEACLLAGLALKFRWREWYGEKHGLDAEQVLGVRPNLVISTMFQAAWEKFFKYMDVQPRFVEVSYKETSMRMNAKDLAAHIDDKTIGVVAIMGNHYGGHYDAVWEIDAHVARINKEKGYQVGIHVDAASGGFIAPFQKNLPPWDFRLKNVLSISASGHKFGVSCCGTGWVVWRERKGLSEHVAISVTYLGGKGDSYTLNFSRPATGVYVQLYQFLRLGWDGYNAQMRAQMWHAQRLRDHITNMMYKGKPRFIIMDDVPNCRECLPVVSARLNPACEFTYDDIDFQHAIAEHQWYVSGYGLNFKHPITEKLLPLFKDESPGGSMFRVVVKSNISDEMIDHLCSAIDNTVGFLDSLQAGYGAVHSQKTMSAIKRALVKDGHSKLADKLDDLRKGAVTCNDGVQLAGTHEDIVRDVKHGKVRGHGSPC